MNNSKRSLFFSTLFILAYAGAITFAVPPLAQYTPGETLDPACAPGDVNCSVEMATFEGWGLTGNAGTDSSVNFIGTTDNQDVVIKRNNTQVARFYSDRISIGIGAGNAAYSNFIGNYAGETAINATGSNFIGEFAGYAANSASNSNFFGQYAGLNATTANNANFFGNYAGKDAIFANNSNFIGGSAGEYSNGGEASNFIGSSSGYFATSVIHSNLIGSSSGSGSMNLYAVNYIGLNAGTDANNSSFSNFIGMNSGYQTTNAQYSNFIGYASGSTANSPHSNFFGTFAGSAATVAYSNFIGHYAGYETTNASYSNLFGHNAGRTFGGNNIGSNNIIIGTNISLPNATANAINLGGILFGTNTYATTSGDPSIVAKTDGRIGVATNTLNYTFQAGNASVAGIVARFQNSTGTCDINPTSTALDCSSDETLKKNILSLENALSSITSLRPVTYAWNTDNTSSPQRVGFIAQEVQVIFPDLVHTDPTTNLLSLSTTNLIPYTIKALQELDMKVVAIEDFDETNENRFVLNLRVWLSNASNRITRIFTGELCLVDEDGVQECINRAELQQLKSLLNQPQPQTISITTPTDSEIGGEDDVVPADASTDDQDGVQDDNQEEVSEIINIDEDAEPVE